MMLRALRRLLRSPFRSWAPKPRPAVVLTGDGFELQDAEKLVGRLRWAEVNRVVAYKRDLWTTDEIFVTFEYSGPSGEPMTFTVSEECPGFPEFMEALARAFPAIAADWYRRVMHPAFMPNFTVLYPPESVPPESKPPAAGNSQQPCR